MRPACRRCCQRHGLAASDRQIKSPRSSADDDLRAHLAGPARSGRSVHARRARGHHRGRWRDSAGRGVHMVPRSHRCHGGRLQDAGARGAAQGTQCRTAVLDRAAAARTEKPHQHRAGVAPSMGRMASKDRVQKNPVHDRTRIQNTAQASIRPLLPARSSLPASLRMAFTNKSLASNCKSCPGVAANKGPSPRASRQGWPFYGLHIACLDWASHLGAGPFARPFFPLELFGQRSPRSCWED